MNKIKYEAGQHFVLDQAAAEIIDNKKLHESINMEIGENLIKKLKENRESKEERKLIKYYLKNLIKETYKMLEGDLWEKRVELKV